MPIRFPVFQRDLRKTLFGLAVCFALGFPASAVAQDQPVKPYVMLLIDTSGSMVFDVCGNYGTSKNNTYTDDSMECPGVDVPCTTCNTFGCGNGLKDDSRIYKVKKGAYNVVSAFGEVTFGLSRYHQTPALFICNSGAFELPSRRRVAGRQRELRSARKQLQPCRCPGELC